MLTGSPTCYVDGTFKIAPPLFAQVFVLMSKKLEGVHPVVYALLPNKRQETYVSMFNILLRIAPGFSPSSFSCDFEQALINAIRVRIIRKCDFLILFFVIIRLLFLVVLSKFKHPRMFVSLIPKLVQAHQKRGAATKVKIYSLNKQQG